MATSEHVEQALTHLRYAERNYEPDARARGEDVLRVVRVARTLDKSRVAAIAERDAALARAERAEAVVAAAREYRDADRDYFAEGIAFAERYERAKRCSMARRAMFAALDATGGDDA